jgi:hypothetical protein
MPVPLRLTTDVGLVEELLVIVICPVAEPAVVGSNCTVPTSAWPGLRVTGNAVPEAEKPAPDIEAVLIVTGAVPVDVRVTDFVTAVFRATLPNERLVALTLSVAVVGVVGFAAFKLRTKLFITELALAARVAD